MHGAGPGGMHGPWYMHGAGPGGMHGAGPGGMHGPWCPGWWCNSAHSENVWTYFQKHSLCT